MGERGNISETRPGVFDGLSGYHEAKRLASEIGKRENLHEDIVFSDAMHVAVTLALDDERIPYTKPNVAWMFRRILPTEVRDILLLRWRHPDDYKNLPMAGATEGLGSEAMNAATELARKLAPEQLDAFLFSDHVGNA